MGTFFVLSNTTGRGGATGPGEQKPEPKPEPKEGVDHVGGRLGASPG